MKFLKLTEIAIRDNLVYTKGHVVLNFDTVRKVIKVRGPDGNHCCRISFVGLPKSEDIYVLETPYDIAEKFSKAELKAEMNVDNPQRLKKYEPTKLNPAKEVVVKPEFTTQYEDDEFELQ